MSIPETDDNVENAGWFSDALVKPLIWNWNYLEKGLLPLENDPAVATLEKVALYVIQFLIHVVPGLVLLTATAPLAAIGLLSRRVESFKFTGIIKTEYLPEKIGVATAEYQVNGEKRHPNSTYARAEKQQKLPPQERSGSALDHWNNIDRVIAHLQEVGFKDYRFSVDWSSIEPKQGQYDDIAIEHYKTLCKKLQEAGIEPLITLHHFNLPTWFADIGEFEKEENIQYFVDFSAKIYEALSPYVKEVTTINEPTLFVFQGYCRKEFPPFKSDLNLAGLVLKHLMMAHAQVYDRLKEIDSDVSISIAHNILRMEPYHPLNPSEQLACLYTTRLMHDVVMNFFKTNVFRYQIPGMVNQTWIPRDCEGKEFNIKDKLDRVDIQFYTTGLIKQVFSSEVMISTCYPHEKMTNMPYRFYPEGLETALEACKELGKPIYITETGIDGLKEEDRIEYLSKIFEIVSRAKEKGIDIRAIYLWTLEDNWEWLNGRWNNKFGLYSFNPVTKAFKLRKVGEWVRDLIKIKKGQPSKEEIA